MWEKEEEVYLVIACFFISFEFGMRAGAFFVSVYEKEVMNALQKYA